MKQNKNISIKQIAKLSGVSVATVSRVINNNGRFSEETRERGVIFPIPRNAADAIEHTH